MDMIKYKYPTPQLLFKGICDTIRAKTDYNNKISHQDIPDKLDDIVTKEEYILAIQNLYNIINEEVTEINDANISSIDKYKFYNCTNLTTINLPKCTSIRDHAFDSCTNLTTINLPKCTSIGEYAFDSCTSLTTINLPKCTSIRDHAFDSCTSLTTIILRSDQVFTISKYTFALSSIANGTGYVYVPDNLVDSYKTTNRWSTYANQIKPLSELPSNLKEEYGYE